MVSFRAHVQVLLRLDRVLKKLLKGDREAIYLDQGDPCLAPNTL